MIAYMYYMHVYRVVIPRPHLFHLCLASTLQRKSTSGMTIGLAVRLALWLSGKILLLQVLFQGDNIAAFLLDMLARYKRGAVGMSEIRHRADSEASRTDQFVNVWHHNVRIDVRNTAALHLRSDIWDALRLARLFIRLSGLERHDIFARHPSSNHKTFTSSSWSRILSVLPLLILVTKYNSSSGTFVHIIVFQKKNIFSSITLVLLLY